MSHEDLMPLHRAIREHADDLTNGLASQSRDLDSYLYALIVLVFSRKVPCDIDTLTALRDLAVAEGFE